MSTIPSSEVQTVLGPVPAAAIGITLPHEHLLVDLTTPYFNMPAVASGQHDATAAFSTELRDSVVADFTCNLDNLRLDSKDLATKELQPFAKQAGNTIVELTSVDIGRDPRGLQAIARQTGLHIVMGCGYYIDRSQPHAIRASTEADVAEEMVNDLLVGAKGTDIRAGIIGEIGVDELSDQEQKVLRAAARAQQATGASINVHVEFILGGRKAGLWAFDVLKDAGADPTRVIFSHQDSSDEDRDYQEMLLEHGIILEYDGFGYEMQTQAHGGLNYPTDDQRIEALRSLIAGGWQRQLLISTDICMKFLLRSFGGHGYGHILQTVVPKMRRAGVSEDALRAMLIDTPRRLLAHQPVITSREGKAVIP